MYAWRIITTAAFIAVKIVAHPGADLERRDAVDNCRLLLVALKASAFCSSFVPIIDVTSTSTNGAALATVTVAGAPCTLTAPAVSITATSTATSTVTERTTTTTTVEGVAPKAKRAVATSAAAALAATTKCIIKGLNVNLSLFACDVIKQAGRLYVKPKIVKTTVAGSTRTITLTKPPVCQTSTPTITATQVSSTTITSTATVTVTLITSPRQPFRTCNNAPGQSDYVAPGNSVNQYACSSPQAGTINCFCAANPGQPNGGAGKCFASYSPFQECTTDNDCPDERRCLGQARLDGSSPLEYYCANTEPCSVG